MTFNDTQKVEVESLIKRGKAMYQIAETIGGGCTWQDIQAYCWQSGTMSWQGSKKIIANCLKKLETAGTADERKALCAKIDEQAKYIYYLGKEMRDRVLEIEKILETIKKL